MSGRETAIVTARSVGVIGLLALSGCADYLDRRETVSFGAGNAQQANLITHVVSPLPPHAADRDLRFHGERMANAVERYRAGNVPEPGTEAMALPVPAGNAEE